MLGVGLHKLCPLDSFGYAFREKKTVRKSTPPEGAKPARGGSKMACQLGRNLAAKAARRPCLGALGALLGRLWRSWSRLGGLLGRAGPLLGASWAPQGLI